MIIQTAILTANEIRTTCANKFYRHKFNRFGSQKAKSKIDKYTRGNETKCFLYLSLNIANVSRYILIEKEIYLLLNGKK